MPGPIVFTHTDNCTREISAGCLIKSLFFTPSFAWPHCFHAGRVSAVLPPVPTTTTTFPTLASIAVAATRSRGGPVTVRASLLAVQA